MSSTYNAITNLQEIEMDSLIVNLATINTALVDNLDCNVGVIDTLTSTTATITSANIPTLTNTTLTNTTSNTTNLNTNNIQPNPVSSAVSLYTTGTGVLTLGNTSNSNLITINQTTLLQADKNLNLSGTGRIITPNIRVSGLTLNKLVLSNGSNDLVSSSWAESDLVILSANNTFTGNNTFSTFNTFNGNILANTLRGTTASSAISLYSTTTGGITIGGSSSGINLSDNTILPANKTITLNATGGKVLCNTYEGTSATNSINLFITTTGVGNPTITLGNLTGGTFSINPNTTMNGNLTLATGKNLTLSSTGKVLCNTFEGTFATESINLFTTTTGSPIFPTITLGNSGAGSGSFFINPNTSMNGNLTLASGKIITLNTTGGKVLCNVFTGTTTSSNLTIGESGDTGNLSIFKTINSNNTYSGTNTFSGGNTHSGSNTFSGATNTFNNTILCSIYTGVNTGDNISLFSTTLGSMILGNAGGGILTINPNTNMTGNLTMANTKTITTNNISGVAIGDTITLFGTTQTGLISIGNAMTTSNIRIGNITNANDSGTLTINKNIVVGANKNLTLSGTSLITTPNILVSGLTASKIVLTDGSDNLVSSSWTDTDFVLKGGSTMTGTLNVNDIQGTTTSSSINLFTNTSGALSTITLSNASNLGVYCQSDLFITTTKALGCNNIYSYSSGDLNLNTFNSANFINLLNNTKVSSGKYITCEKYDSISAITTLAIGSTNTTALIRIGGALTTGTLQLGTIGTMTGLIQCNSDVSIGTTATNKGLACNYFTALQATDLVRFLQNTTTGNVRICENHTTGTITIGHLTPSSDSGTCQMNKNLTLGTSSGLNQKTISCNYYSGLSATSDIAIGSSTSSGVITLGDSSQITPFTGGTYNYSFLGVGRWLGSINRRWAYTNVGYGNATTPTLFKNQFLTGKYLTSTMYAGAQTDEWCSFDSDAEGEGSAFIQNGNTSCVINPGDQSTLWWLDEDTINGSPAGSTTYAWSGWKISTAGAISTSSDRRLKRNINTIIVDSGFLDKLLLLQIVNFKWKAPTEEKYYKNGVLRRKYQEVHTGYIAQDVKEVFPDVVERENTDAYWTIKKDDLSAKYHLGVQELIKQNKSQQVEINNNKTLIDTQQTIIDDLTARLVRLEQLILNP